MAKRSSKPIGPIVVGGLLFGAVGVLGALLLDSTTTANDERARKDQQLADGLRRLLARVAAALQVETPPLVLSAAVANAASDGYRILVNPTWARATLAQFCADRSCNNAVMIGVLAHEVGHHVEGDALINAPWSKRDRELRADRYAGEALAVLGVPHDHFARVLWAISQHHSGGSPFEYPTPRDRIAAIDGAYQATIRSMAAAYYARHGYLSVA